MILDLIVKELVIIKRRAWKIAKLEVIRKTIAKLIEILKYKNLINKKNIERYLKRLIKRLRKIIEKIVSWAKSLNKIKLF